MADKLNHFQVQLSKGIKINNLLNEAVNKNGINLNQQKIQTNSMLQSRNHHQLTSDYISNESQKLNIQRYKSGNQKVKPRLVGYSLKKDSNQIIRTNKKQQIVKEAFKNQPKVNYNYEFQQQTNQQYYKIGPFKDQSKVNSNKTNSKYYQEQVQRQKKIQVLYPINQHFCQQHIEQNEKIKGIIHKDKNPCVQYKGKLLKSRQDQNLKAMTKISQNAPTLFQKTKPQLLMIIKQIMKDACILQKNQKQIQSEEEIMKKLKQSLMSIKKLKQQLDIAKKIQHQSPIKKANQQSTVFNSRILNNRQPKQMNQKKSETFNYNYFQKYFYQYFNYPINAMQFNKAEVIQSQFKKYKKFTQLFKQSSILSQSKFETNQFLNNLIKSFKTQKQFRGLQLMYKKDYLNQDYFKYLYNQSQNILFLFESEDKHIFGALVQKICQRQQQTSKGILFNLKQKKQFWSKDINNDGKHIVSSHWQNDRYVLYFGRKELRLTKTDGFKLTISMNTNSSFKIKNREQLIGNNNQSEIQLKGLQILKVKYL